LNPSNDFYNALTAEDTSSIATMIGTDPAQRSGRTLLPSNTGGHGAV
jgi:hypothetical protein